MSSNLDYLNPALRPLEDKINAYLAAEKQFTQAEIEAVALPDEQAQQQAAAAQFEQRPASGSFPQHADQVRQELQNLRDELRQLREEIIGLLPTRDEWVKVNLGYGPSRVGAFRVEGATDEYELRIVH